jgi:glutamate-5-semialdehyde dehydrogenase
MESAQSYVIGLAQRARAASNALAQLDGASKTTVLKSIAAAIRSNSAKLIEANAKDLAAAKESNLAQALVERLKLDENRVAKMADAVEQIANQPDPVGQTLEGYVRPNGLRIEKRRVPMGVVLFFYESRPNVTADAAALCLKSNNAVILRGGKEAFHSNKAIAEIVSDALKNSAFGIRHPAFADSAQLIESTDRALVPPLLKLNDYIDVVIPRGGESLIRAVVEQSTIPVLKHFTGNCHIYVDSHYQGMEDAIGKVIVNAKTGYPGGAVCNAVEHVLFHKEAAPALLAKVCADLASKGVEIRGDDATRKLYPSAKPTTDDDWTTEYLAFIVGVKIVDSMDEAIAHINTYGSHHTDAILTSNTRSADHFITNVHSASVMVNASTRFADGGEYGLGAELGISTDKLHARGPMGAADLCTYKWIVTGNGHIRP